MFFEAFHGGGPRSREDRVWMLAQLRRGLRSEHDLSLCRHRHVLLLLMSLHDSALADGPSKRASLAVLSAAAELPAGAAALLHDHGLPGWITNCCSRPSAPPDAAAPLLHLLQLLLRSEAAASMEPAQRVQCALALRAGWRLACGRRRGTEDEAPSAAQGLVATAGLARLGAASAEMLGMLLSAPGGGAALGALGARTLAEWLRCAAGEGCRAPLWTLGLLSAVSGAARGAEGGADAEGAAGEALAALRRDEAVVHLLEEGTRLLVDAAAQGGRPCRVARAVADWAALLGGCGRPAADGPAALPDAALRLRPRLGLALSELAASAGTPLDLATPLYREGAAEVARHLGPQGQG
jgi:hypothetical protein